MLAPILGCNDIDVATKFYVEALGCDVLASFSLAEDGGDPCYRTLSLKGDHFHLTSFPGDQGTGKAMYVYLDTPEEVDAIYAKVKDYPGTQITVVLGDQSWGLREFNIKDGFGNLLRFGADIVPENGSG